MARKLPRLVISGLSGDSGKTVVSLSLVTAFRQGGARVSVFKKGPDYIDPAWLSFAAGSVCRNLDTYLISAERTFETFTSGAETSDISVIEGNRGIFDGIDPDGTYSTAELAKLLKAPVILVVNATKTTGTVAALVKGCVDFDPSVRFAGIILNRVRGWRHERVITEAVEKHNNLPVLGSIPNLGENRKIIPGRHLGLVTPSEFDEIETLGIRLSDIAEEYLDIERLAAIANDAPSLTITRKIEEQDVPVTTRVGYFSDPVFTFYYPENLEALSENGAELVPVSSLKDTELPDVDALYIGGGFPETHAGLLAGNLTMLESVRKAAENGLPIYAECGGLMYLSKSVFWEGTRYRMASVFPHELVMHDRPFGHGYTRTKIDRDNPFFECGIEIKGHEFHYSGPEGVVGQEEGCMKVERGVGLGNGRDGLTYKNTLACYTHIHSNSIQEWAPAVITKAREYRNGKGAAFPGTGGTGL